MRKVAILTDTNSGITPKEAEALGIGLILMPIIIDGATYLEWKDLSYEEFFKIQDTDANITTSQPSMQSMIDHFDTLLKDYESVVFIPMSSGLSGTCQTATMLANDYDGKVQVVNNLRISVTMRQSVLDALHLAEHGFSALEIKNILEREKFNSSIYITLQTLKHLKKGGRITPAAAAIGTLLKIKPVLQIQGDKLDSYAKARGMNKAQSIMIDAMQKDIDGRFAKFAAENKVHMKASYTLTADDPERKAWEDHVRSTFGNFDFTAEPLPMSISTHIGYGAYAVACSCYIPELEGE